MARCIESIQSKAVSGKIYTLCYRQMLPVLTLKLLKWPLTFIKKETKQQTVVHFSKSCVVYYKGSAVQKLLGNEAPLHYKVYGSLLTSIE